MIPIALTIAGSDSSGGAGIQADLNTFVAIGIYGATVVTAVTSQDTRYVHDLFLVPAAVVGRQIDAVFGDLSPQTVKVGMLGSRANVEVVADKLRTHAPDRIVLDTVLASTAGMDLLEPDALEALRTGLVRGSLLVTPNIREAGLLIEKTVDNVSDMADAARALHGMGANNVLVTGGHLSGNEVVDVFYDGQSIHHIKRSRIPKSPHGTGCVLSAAAAAYLARGFGVQESVVRAADFTAQAIRSGFAPGHGEVCNPAGM